MKYVYVVLACVHSVSILLFKISFPVYDSYSNIGLVLLSNHYQEISICSYLQSATLQPPKHLLLDYLCCILSDTVMLSYKGELRFLIK